MYGPVRQTGLIKNIDVNIFDKFPEDYEWIR
jgi:hypothetical protein